MFDLNVVAVILLEKKNGNIDFHAVAGHKE